MNSEENQKSENQAEFSSRMAAMAAMFPNLPSSITASLAFPSSQSLPSPLSALNAAVQRNSSPLLDRPTNPTFLEPQIKGQPVWNPHPLP